ncbi:hypothetical protein Y032_0001g298 [Ancylostoma ceylanicum]|uniref:Uncharacterized protein n=1 Tax=Ancylostoma ceylanicum TaxID=53326 RepID=A0A016W3M8_9BILA|nr:hypothetical protein Y032_0001g298 [Ancylostoma ceylanicum]
MTANSIKEALEKYKASKMFFAQIGMYLREYTSNSQEVNAQITSSDKLDNGHFKKWESATTFMKTYSK